MGFHKFAALLLIQVGKVKFANENESLPDIKEKCKHLLLLTDKVNSNNIVNSIRNVMLICKCKGHLANQVKLCTSFEVKTLSNHKK